MATGASPNCLDWCCISSTRMGRVSGSEVMVKKWFTTEAFPVSRILVD